MSEQQYNYFTSESVSEGHPDKMADQISDAIVQYVVSRDPKARVAVETVVKGVTEGPNAGSYVILAGELTTDVDVPFEEIVRKTINAIGYDNDEIGYNGNTVQFTNLIGQQSPDINMGVDREDGELGAGDQGIMFGIACDETEERFPLAVTMANKLLAVLSHDRKSKTELGKHLRPDAKSQVTLAYDDNGQVVGIDTIVISVQHDEKISLQELREGVIREIITPVVAEFGYGDHVLYDGLAESNTFKMDGNDLATTKFCKVLVNPTGNFVIGGPVGDCGLTGRKIIVDTSGGYGRHGGGAFCFAAGTPVKTESGFKAIEQVQPGDKVWTVNEQTNEPELKAVRQVFSKTAEESYDLLKLTLANGEEIFITENHEVRVKRATGHEWVRAGDLTTADEIVDMRDVTFTVKGSAAAA